MPWEQLFHFGLATLGYGLKYSSRAVEAAHRILTSDHESDAAIIENRIKVRLQ